jgi:predicted enzyme related to lactoylglutathione lyase
MPRPVHFDISADDPQRAQNFYSTVFGWKFNKWEEGGPMEYWMVTTGDAGPGINGGLSRRGPHTINPTATSNTVEVPSLDDFASKVTTAGGKVLQPKMAIPGIGWFAYCADTEGNGFGIMQPDSNAK